MDEMTLKEWTINFVKHRDVFLKKLVDYAASDSEIVFHFKDGDQSYVILNELDESVFKLLTKKEFNGLSCTSSLKNFNFMVNNWDSLKKYNNLSLLFADLKSLKYLAIKPFVHDRISDPESLIRGLESLFSNAFH